MAAAENAIGPAPNVPRECVVLLHGLARSENSMQKMQQALQDQGYRVVNRGYPSRQQPIELLAADAILAGVDACGVLLPMDRVHFVTHSMGGILVRYFLAKQSLPNLGRVVMLSPPNHGSETVDKMGKMPGFGWLNGPAGQQLGTRQTSLPNSLGPATFELGIITGNRSINLLLSALIPGPDDGKVGVDSAKLKGMADFLVVPHSHPFIMKKPRVIEQTIHFLEQGRFLHELAR